jgi:NAD(P)H-nitrite reductase large subunit
MDYYTTLRRLDWDVFHVRATEYYTDPDKTLKRLSRRLNRAGITPKKSESVEKKSSSPDLYELVTKKAYNIRIRWNEPTSPSI